MKIASSFLIIVLLLSTSLLNAQKSEPVTIPCIDHQPNCDSKYVNGIQEKILYTNDILLSAALLRDDGRLTAEIFIQNRKESKQRVEVAPGAVQLLKLRGSEAPLEVKRRVASDLARSLERRQRIAAALSAGSVAMATNTATVRSSDGTTSTVQLPDTNAQAQAQKQAASNIGAAHDLGGSLVAKELKRNTLDPGESTNGRISLIKK